MTIQAVVDRGRKKRVGRGFSRNELKEVDLSLIEALKLGIPIDIRRSTNRKENVENLRRTTKELKLELLEEKETAIVDLTEVKSIGPKTAEQLKEAGIKNANELAASTPVTVAEAIGFSEKRARDLIKDANALLK